MTEQEVLNRELAVMQAMAAHIEGYLASDVTRWDMGVAGMPPMTIGGILMRRRRLDALDARLTPEQRRIRDETNQQFDEALVEKVVRFEQRAQDELHARLREWTNYLRDLPSRSAAKPETYAFVADTRVVIGVLIDKLREPPYQLAPRISRDLAAVDRRLQSIWNGGPFIWDAIWEPAYPGDDYWYLYGGPREG
ncbi:MAG: hypothetical protein R3C44_11140 [Chloroflexota bacterium]